MFLVGVPVHRRRYTGGHNSAVDARAASIGSDIPFGGGYRSRPWQVFLGEQDALAAVPLWDDRDYVEWCIGRLGQ